MTSLGLEFKSDRLEVLLFFLNFFFILFNFFENFEICEKLDRNYTQKPIYISPVFKS